MTARITLTELTCIRMLGAAGMDEPALYLAGDEVWQGEIATRQTLPVNESRRFDHSVVVELRERGNNSHKLLGTWTISDQARTGRQLTVSSSVYHYEVTCDVE